ncbi:trafficking protein particle complex subunit 10, TRAPPC10, putative [Bodo saltans]|uniref:Trafficking protein particle complex subunit 10, TRAPPC10, putative n=1 Tax=Bodo saltans TaxID=75058 RepID=A0A0S4IWW0_BODSA|nr:trafficking protein particle complex subunit 10, TRAPPC10, putative [Bodo saltans]|eukprot:CUF82317.1 trafficking protein particle complex subunit 10, TRAPPC10, putative [Bodo saltans]
MDLKDQLGLTAEQCFGSVVLHSKKLWSVDSEPVHVIELNGIEPHYDPILHAITLIVPFTPCHAGSYRVASFRLDVGALPLLQHYHGAAPLAGAIGVNSPLSSSTSGMDLSANRKSVTTVTPSGINNIINHHDAALRCTLFVTPEPDAGIELSVTRPPPMEHCFGDSIQTFELGIHVAEPLRAVPPAPPSAFSTPQHSDVPDLALADTPVDYASPTSTLLRVSSKDCGVHVEAQIPRTSLCFFEGGSVDGMAALQSSLDKKVSQFQFVTPQRARGNSSGADARLARDISMRRASSDEPPKSQYADIEPLAQVRVGKPPVRRNDRYQHPHHGRRTSGRLARPQQRMSPSEQQQGNLSSMPRDGPDLSGTLNGGALNGSFANYHKNGPMGGSLTDYPNGLDGTIGRDGGGGGVTFLIEAENNNANGVNNAFAPPPMPRSLQHPMFASLSASLRACLAEMAPNLDRVTVFQNTLASPVAARFLSNQSMSSPASPDLDASMSPQRTLNSSDLGTTAQPPSGSVETPQKEHHHNKDAEESNAHKDLRYQRGMSATIVANEYSTKLMRQATATSNVEGELLHVDGHTYEPTGFTTLNLFIPPPAHSETTTPLSKKSACITAGTSLAATKLSLTIPMFPTHMKAEKVPLTFACRRSREISLRHTSLDSTFRQAFEVHYTFTPFQERVFATATVTNTLPLPPGSKGLWIRHAVLDVFPAEISETSRGYYVHSTMPANTRLFHAPIGYGDSVALTFELRLLPSYRCLQEVVRHGVRLCLAYSLYDTYHEEGVVPLPLRKLTPSLVASTSDAAMRSPSTSALFMSEEERALQEDWSVYNGLESLKQLHETTSCNILFATADHFTSKHLCVFSVMMFLSGADDDAREGGDEDSDEDDDDALLANARGISNYPSNYSDNGSMEDDAEEFNDDGTFRRKRSSRRSVNNNPRQSMQQQNHTLHAATNARGMHDVGEPVHFVAVIHAQANNWPTDCDPEGARFLVSLEVSPIEWMVVGRMRHVRVLSQSGEHQIRFSAVPVGSGAAVSFPTLSIRRIEEEGLLGGGDLAEGDPLAVDVVKARASLRLRRPTPNITLRNEPV